MPNVKRQYRVGLVGYGGRGRGLADHWKGVSEAKLVAVADMLPELRQKARDTLGEVELYPDHRTMLEQANLDIVTIATRGEHHAQITHDAAAASIKGIYCEKPMACKLADADRMIADCHASGTVFVMGHQRRWTPQIIRVRDAIRDGAIGQPTHGYIYWPTGRVGSNGTHFFDALNFILDSTPVQVAGMVVRGLNLEKVDDHPIYGPGLMKDPGAMGFITYANGVRMAVDCMSDVLIPYTYLFCGTRGRIDLYEVSYEVNYHARDTDTRNHNDARKALVMRDFDMPPYVRGEAEETGFRDLIHCIETGATPASTGENGRAVLETMVAFHLSSDANMQPVSLPLPESAQDYTLTIH